ncbi:MAG TPA: DUF2752 domain-containing protein [Bacilli bacterium]|nr:DUF2752 domain-containing protein [Bacilli bacterium]
MKYKKNLYLLVIIFIAFLYYFKIIDIPCLFLKITHFYCPGCGITRAIRSLLSLNFYQAFRYNNLIIILIPVFLIYYFEAICNKFKIKNLNISKYMKNKFWLSILIIIIFYGIIRNIPLFNYLLPTKV